MVSSCTSNHPFWYQAVPITALTAQNQGNQSCPIHLKLRPYDIIVFNLILTTSERRNSDSTLHQIRTRVRVRVGHHQCLGTSHSLNTDSTQCSISVFRTHTIAATSHHNILQSTPESTFTPFTPFHPCHIPPACPSSVLSKAYTIYQQCIKVVDSPDHFDLTHAPTSEPVPTSLTACQKWGNQSSPTEPIF